MTRLDTAFTVAALAAVWTVVPQPAAAQQAPTPQASTTRPQTAVPSEAPRGPVAASQRRSGALQGFSVVLVIGELQGTSAGDDVPVAARKALADMREFLPYKNYRLLDAGWLMCCAEHPRPSASQRRSGEEPSVRTDSTLSLRGPDEQEYELHLVTSRADNSRVFVQFHLIGTAPVSADTVNLRTNQRRLAELEDKAEMQQRQMVEGKKRVENGGAQVTAELLKLEMEMRGTQRDIAELRDRIARGGRGQNERSPRAAVIDTTFTMAVGETVVVGASKPRGATKALIALVTAVPRGGTGATRD